MNSSYSIYCKNNNDIGAGWTAGTLFFTVVIRMSASPIPGARIAAGSLFVSGLVVSAISLVKEPI